MSQAVISIERLENYMKSGELKEDSVEREEGCSGNISVEVKDRTFSWEDEGGEEVLKNLNLEIEKRQLAAVVGTVGSGKSSLWLQFSVKCTKYQERSQFVVPQHMLHKHHGFKMVPFETIYYLVHNMT
ncbi:hypothetical protein LWI28_007653 [Acer negundo]|uniref:Uncharacterized protein n=1 Tax=Acer negundo TaxID=4023 RepID=A0AAD5P107_ACENE|nr:hypothetical protein LWI28_007653 [Acer negundo]